jgi:hypothetical protein
MKKYNKLFLEKRETDIEVLSNLDETIEALVDAKHILANEKFKEATNVSLKNYNTKMGQATALLNKATDNLISIEVEELGRDKSIKLYVQCRLKLVGTNTALSKEFPVSSWYSGSNVHSLIIEMKNIIVDINVIPNRISHNDILERFIAQYMTTCISYNNVVQDNVENLIIKKPNDLIIPDDFINIER